MCVQLFVWVCGLCGCVLCKYVPVLLGGWVCVWMGVFCASMYQCYWVGGCVDGCVLCKYVSVLLGGLDGWVGVDGCVLCKYVSVLLGGLDGWVGVDGCVLCKYVSVLLGGWVWMGVFCASMCQCYWVGGCGWVCFVQVCVSAIRWVGGSVCFVQVCVSAIGWVGLMGLVAYGVHVFVHVFAFAHTYGCVFVFTCVHTYAHV